MNGWEMVLRSSVIFAILLLWTRILGRKILAVGGIAEGRCREGERRCVHAVGPFRKELYPTDVRFVNNDRLNR